MICTDPPVIMAVSAPMCQGDNQMFAGYCTFSLGFYPNSLEFCPFTLDFDLVENCIVLGTEAPLAPESMAVVVL